MADYEKKERERKKNDPMNAPVGSGAADQARKTIGRDAPAYKDYQMMKYSAGEQPVSYEEWKKGAR